ncbi:hypothetical protein ACWEVP_16900 [Amycolatopsis sp. NPDC003865]
MTAFPELDENDENAAMKPVFVDPTGRRRRIVRRIALAAFGGLLLYVAVFVAALFGAPIPTAALIPMPGLVPEQATSVAPPPATGDTARPTGEPRSTAPSPTVAPASAPGSRAATTEATAPTTSAPATAVTSEHRNTRAPTSPPGQTRTTPPGNGR